LIILSELKQETAFHSFTSTVLTLPNVSILEVPRSNLSRVITYRD